MLGGQAKIVQKRLFRITIEPINYLENSQRPYDVMVQFRDLQISSEYNKRPIISSTNLYQVKEDPNNSWARRPGEMITDVVVGYLREAQLFRQLVRQRDLFDRRPDYILNGAITALERLDSGDIWYAHMVMTLELENAETGQVIWVGEITEEDDIEVFDSDMQQTVVATSEILRRKMEHFIRRIDLIFLRQALDDPSLQIFENGAAKRDSTTVDSTKTRREIPSHYELIPGKIAR